MEVVVVGCRSRLSSQTRFRSVLERAIGATPDRLEQLGEALLDFKSLADLDVWLQHIGRFRPCDDVCRSPGTGMLAARRRPGLKNHR